MFKRRFLSGELAYLFSALFLLTGSRFSDGMTIELRSRFDEGCYEASLLELRICENAIGMDASSASDAACAMGDVSPSPSAASSFSEISPFKF